MSYVVLARKWRPRLFCDLLGQEHVSQALTNAIISNRVAHAFLFTGPRGVGKTSAARILAKALCCIQRSEQEAQPCGTCQMCEAITNGSLTDVFEIDAASHTGVDNIREIIDNVRYLPAAARYKIYVIDEVHMLSTGAFNALLKTLEEPPAHVKFVLATTDPHKVPVTILSRCQRYDFRRIDSSRIAARLSEILTVEKIPHNEDSLVVLSRQADGSMRDAQSLLEQVLSFAGGETLTAALVRDALGVVGIEWTSKTIQGVLERNPQLVFHQVRDVYQRGQSLERATESLIEFVRDLLVARLSEQAGDLIDRPQEEIARLRELSKSKEPAELERLFEQLCVVQEDVHRSPQPRFVLEVGLASLAAEPVKANISNLLGQLERVQRNLEMKGIPSPRADMHSNAAQGMPPRQSFNSAQPPPKRPSFGSGHQPQQTPTPAPQPPPANMRGPNNRPRQSSARSKVPPSPDGSSSEPHTNVEPVLAQKFAPIEEKSPPKTQENHRLEQRIPQIPIPHGTEGTEASRPSKIQENHRSSEQRVRPSQPQTSRSFGNSRVSAPPKTCI